MTLLQMANLQRDSWHQFKGKEGAIGELHLERLPILVFLVPNRGYRFACGLCKCVLRGFASVSGGSHDFRLPCSVIRMLALIGENVSFPSCPITRFRGMAFAYPTGPAPCPGESQASVDGSRSRELRLNEARETQEERCS